MTYMDQALEEAKKARDLKEVPVGCVIVKEGRIIGRGYNQVETKRDATAHAEILAIKEASKSLGAWRLEGADLYVTLEPCAMCAGAIVQARLARVIFGARDQRKGCCGTVYNLVEEDNFNHRAQATYQESKEAREILSNFFASLRSKSQD